MRQLKTRPCEVCGKLTTKRRASRAGWVCVECAAGRVDAWNTFQRAQAAAVARTYSSADSDAC